MARGDVCGNDYARPMVIRINDKSGTFDCSECAIQAMAPRCEHCGCHVIGHGVESQGRIFCFAHCAQETGAHTVHA